MRLKIEFNYQSETRIDKKDVSKIVNGVDKRKLALELSEEINKILLEKKLWNGTGGVTEINYTIGED